MSYDAPGNHQHNFSGAGPGSRTPTFRFSAGRTDCLYETCAFFLTTVVSNILPMSFEAMITLAAAMIHPFAAVHCGRHFLARL